MNPMKMKTLKVNIPKKYTILEGIVNLANDLIFILLQMLSIHTPLYYALYIYER